MKSLTIFRHGFYNQYYQLKEESAIQIYQKAKELIAIFGCPGLILTSDILRAQQTADVISLATRCSNIEIDDKLADINYYLMAYFKSEFVSMISSRYQKSNHIILVTHEPNIRFLLHRDLSKGEFVTLQSDSWDDIFKETNSLLTPAEVITNNYHCTANETLLIQKILTYA